MRYAEKVQHSTTKIGARFKEYRPETGSWIFEVTSSICSFFLFHEDL